MSSNKMKTLFNKIRQDKNQELIPLDYYPQWAETLAEKIDGEIMDYHIITHHGVDPAKNTYDYRIELLTNLGLVEVSVKSQNDPEVSVQGVSCKLHKLHDLLNVSFGQLKIYDPKLSDIPAMIYDLEIEHTNYRRLLKVMEDKE